jgi:hypothetical protein
MLNDSDFSVLLPETINSSIWNPSDQLEDRANKIVVFQM